MSAAFLSQLNRPFPSSALHAPREGVFAEEIQRRDRGHRLRFLRQDALPPVDVLKTASHRFQTAGAGLGQGRLRRSGNVPRPARPRTAAAKPSASDALYTSRPFSSQPSYTGMSRSTVGIPQAQSLQYHDALRLLPAQKAKTSAPQYASRSVSRSTKPGNTTFSGAWSMASRMDWGRRRGSVQPYQRK